VATAASCAKRITGGRDRRRIAAYSEQRELNEINSQHLLLHASQFGRRLREPNNKHREIYLTDAIAQLASKGEAVLAQIAPDRAKCWVASAALICSGSGRNIPCAQT
jgi:hypothetical protein